MVPKEEFSGNKLKVANFFEFAVFEKRLRDGRTDRPTKLLIELLFATENL